MPENNKPTEALASLPEIYYYKKTMACLPDKFLPSSHHVPKRFFQTDNHNMHSVTSVKDGSFSEIKIAVYFWFTQLKPKVQFEDLLTKSNVIYFI